MLYSGFFVLLSSTLFVAVWAEVQYRYKSLPPNCGFTHRGSFEKICSGKYPLDVSIRYRDEYIEPGMPYSIYKSKLLEDVYFFSFRFSELHQCRNFHLNASTPSDFLCLDEAPAEDEAVNTKPGEKAPATFKVNRTRGGRRHKWKGSGSSKERAEDSQGDSPAGSPKDSPEDSPKSKGSRVNPQQGVKRHKLKPLLTGDPIKMEPLNKSLGLRRGRRQTDWGAPSFFSDYIFNKTLKNGTTSTTTTTTTTSTTTINPLHKGITAISLRKAVLYCFHFDIHIADELLRSCFKANKQKFTQHRPKKVVMHYTLDTHSKAAPAAQPAWGLIVLLIAFKGY